MKNHFLKIAFDAKRITHNKTGLGNYGRYVIHILSTYYPQNSYLLFSPGKGNEYLKKQINPSENITYHYPRTWHPKAFWRSFSIVSDLKKESLTLFHGLSNELPFGLRKANVKSIVTIHDLIFIRYPQFYKWIDRKIYTYKFKKACLLSDRIIAISEMTKRDIVNYFNIPAEKIDVVYQGCDPSFTIEKSSKEKNAIRQKYNLPPNYMLSVGSIESRKNLLLIVKALQHIPSDIHLIAIGKRTAYTRMVEEYIQNHNLSDRVQLLHNVPFNELPAFYQMASLFVYPSFFEGFGIPIIEALHSGVPVIAATGSCLEEAGGPNSVYINPDNEQQIVKAINTILSDKELYDKMAKTGKEYVKRFSEQAIARDIMHVYTKVLN